jgi:hypothetical protein
MLKPIRRCILNSQSKMSHFQSGEARCGANQPPTPGVWAFDGNAAWQSHWIPVLILVIAFNFTPQLAHAQGSSDYMQCYEGCQSLCEGRTNAIDNSDCVNRCASDCDKEDTPPRPYGAIAYGTDRSAEGISWNKWTQAEADQAAFGSCSKHGNNCKIVYRFRDTCAALAVAMGSQHYGSATGERWSAMKTRSNGGNKRSGRA